MMKSFCSRLAVPFLGLLLVLCPSCTKTGRVPTGASGKPAVFEPSTVVGEIGSYVITRKDLQERLNYELRPDPDEESSPEPKSVDPKTLLMKMLGEKAMIIDAKEQNYLIDEKSREGLEEFKKEKLASLTMQTYLKDKAIVTDTEIDEKIKAEPGLDREVTKAKLKSEKTKKLVAELYNSLCEELNVQKVKDNFPKAVAIYQRLISSAGETYGLVWVRDKQVDELPQEEKDIALVTYKGGKVTLKDWLRFLCDISPPSRPTDLSTVEGFEKVLDIAMRKPIFAAGGEFRRVDKDGSLVRQIKEREEMYLFGRAIEEKVKGVKDPTDEEIVAYFNNNLQKLAKPDMLKIDQIWLVDRKTARKAKAEIDSGRSFDAAKQDYSLDKESEPVTVYRDSETEREFFPELWVGGVNEIVGPVGGVYHDRATWRIVKILEKQPRIAGYAKEIRENIRRQMCYEQRQSLLAEYREELLKKYPYRIYTKKMKDIKPVNVP